MNLSPIVLAPMMLALAMAVQSPGGGQNAVDKATERLGFMKDSVRVYELSRDGDRTDMLKLNAVPVFRMGKQGAQEIEEGAIFLWIGEAGRPEAAIQVFLIRDPSEPDGLWLHEFTSLSPRPLAAVRDGRPRWSPRIGGLEFKPLPGAPKPAGSAAQRLRQMRSFAEDFRISDNFKVKGWSELRLLPTPIARYGDPKAKVVDGALFAFVIGTDPEVFLFLESRAGVDGPEWQYALAPMTVYAIKGTYRNRPVWELPDRQPCWDPSKPFFDCVYRP